MLWCHQPHAVITYCQPHAVVTYHSPPGLETCHQPRVPHIWSHNSYRVGKIRSICRNHYRGPFSLILLEHNFANPNTSSSSAPQSNLCPILPFTFLRAADHLHLHYLFKRRTTAPTYYNVCILKIFVLIEFTNNTILVCGLWIKKKFEC